MAVARSGSQARGACPTSRSTRRRSSRSRAAAAADLDGPGAAGPCRRSWFAAAFPRATPRSGVRDAFPAARRRPDATGLRRSDRRGRGASGGLVADGEAAGSRSPGALPQDGSARRDPHDIDLIRPLRRSRTRSQRSAALLTIRISAHEGIACDELRAAITEASPTGATRASPGTTCRWSQHRPDR